MSYIFTLSGESSVLSCDIFPELELDVNGEYLLGLINFESFNSIPNIEEGCNKFYYIDKTNEERSITIQTGSYEISDIESYLRKQMGDKRPDKIESSFQRDNSNSNSEVVVSDMLISITPNNNTLRSEIKCTQDIDFTKHDSIGPLLGFKKRKLIAYRNHSSDYTVNILKVNAIVVECNIVTSSYFNGSPTHTVHTFFPSVPPGFKIIETPANVIYLPINTRNIDNITLKILDQQGNPINFREETITVTLHLKKL